MLVDLIAAWEYGRSRFQLNGQNVGDQTYVSTRLSRGDRVVTGTLSYRF
jgi:outer membrane receptor protein involved in Fe transport